MQLDHPARRGTYGKQAGLDSFFDYYTGLILDIAGAFHSVGIQVRFGGLLHIAREHSPGRISTKPIRIEAYDRHVTDVQQPYGRIVTGACETHVTGM